MLHLGFKLTIPSHHGERMFGLNMLPLRIVCKLIALYALEVAEHPRMNNTVHSHE